MSSWNPIRRKPLVPKPRKTRISMPWRRPKVRLDAQGMKQLREYVFNRSGAQCENSVEGERCVSRIYWGSFHLSHIVGRGRGGSDSPENTLACCWECHDNDTQNRVKLQPHKGWEAVA
jgi:hypothetical protein